VHPLLFEELVSYHRVFFYLPRLCRSGEYFFPLASHSPFSESEGKISSLMMKEGNTLFLHPQFPLVQFPFWRSRFSEEPLSENPSSSFSFFGENQISRRPGLSDCISQKALVYFCLRSRAFLLRSISFRLSLLRGSIFRKSSLVSSSSMSAHFARRRVFSLPPVYLWLFYSSSPSDSHMILSSFCLMVSFLCFFLPQAYDPSPSSHTLPPPLARYPVPQVPAPCLFVRSRVQCLPLLLPLIFSPLCNSFFFFLCNVMLNPPAIMLFYVFLPLLEIKKLSLGLLSPPRRGLRKTLSVPPPLPRFFSPETVLSIFFEKGGSSSPLSPLLQFFPCSVRAGFLPLTIRTTFFSVVGAKRLPPSWRFTSFPLPGLPPLVSRIS